MVANPLRVALGAVLLSAPTLAPARLPAQESATQTAERDSKENVATFHRALRRVHENMARGQFRKSLTDLQRILERHKNQHYAFVRKAELLEDFRRCSFYLRFAPPEPEAALHGRLLKYDKSNDQAEIEYSKKTIEDFAEPQELADSHRLLRWHPAAWRAPFTIEVSGSAYRQTVHAIDRSREVRVGTTLHLHDSASGHVEVTFGNQREVLGARPAKVVRWPSEGPELVDSKGSPARIGEKFRLRVDVGKREVRATYNGKPLFRFKRNSEAASRFAIEGTEFDKLTIRGRIDPGWIEDRIDHRRQLQLDEFDRNYAAEEVPEWLSEGEIPNRHSFNPVQSWPRDAEDKHWPVLRDLVSMFESSEFEAGVDYVESLDRDVLPGNTRWYILARFYNELDEIDKAVHHCDRLLTWDPDFVTGRKLRAELRVRQGQGEDAAIADYRSMLIAHPASRELYVDLAVLLIQAGRAKEASAVLRDAVSRTGNHAELMTLQRMLLSVTRGPTWQHTHEHRSAHYVVRSNIDKEICETAADLLEEAHAVYEKALGKPRRVSKDPYRVFLFSSRTGYERFCNDILGERDTHTAGLYSAALKQLLIWNLPDKDKMLQTIRHEGFHQYLDSLVHDSPTWLNEGFAEYFETVPGRGATSELDDHIRQDHVQKLRNGGLQPTSRFLAMPSKAFYRGSNRNYAQAWATIQYLRHGPEVWRDVIPAILRQLGSGKSPKTAVRLATKGRDLAKLHREIEAWLQRSP